MIIRSSCKRRGVTNTQIVRNKSTEETTNEGEEAEQQQDNAPKERKFFREQEFVDGFPVFDPFMNKKTLDAGAPGMNRIRRAYVKNERDVRARENRMPTDQDWTNVWPNASMFKQSAVPLALRQGKVKNMSENDGLPPTKYGNTELMKIPNFLHLTPPHIKKHCQALEKFCSEWPKNFHKDHKESFPVKMKTSNYVYDGPNIRDDRARVVELRIDIRDLKLDHRSEQKLIHLATPERYNARTKIMTLVADRCPFRAQNEEYARYLLTTLYYESKNIEDWETSEITEDDRLEFAWEKSQSKANIEKVFDLKNDEGSYASEVTESFNRGKLTKDYKKSVLNLLGLKQKENTSSTE